MRGSSLFFFWNQNSVNSPKAVTVLLFYSWAKSYCSADRLGSKKGAVTTPSEKAGAGMPVKIV